MPSARSLISLAAVAIVGAIAVTVAWGHPAEPAADADPRVAAFAARLLSLSDEESSAALDGARELLTPALSEHLRAAGRELRDSGDLAAALHALRQARRVAERLGDRALVAEAGYAIGDVLLDRSAFAEAERELAASLALFEQLGDRAGQVRALNYIGVSLKLRGRFDEALALYHRALALAESAGDDAATARQLFSIGNIHKDRGDYAAALESYQRALALSPAGEMTGSGVLFNIGVVHEFQGDLDLALDFYRQALAIDRAAGLVLEQAYDSYGVGAMLLRQGRTEEGSRAIAEAIAVFERSGAKHELLDVENELAAQLVSDGRPGEAAPHAARGLALAEEIGDGYGLCDSLVTSAEIALAAGEPAQARALAERAAVIAERLGSLLGLHMAQTALGDALAALDRRSEAQAAYGAAIEASLRQRAQIAGGEVERQRFFEQRLRPFHALLATLVEEGRIEEALGVAEAARARVLADVLQRGRVVVTTRMTDAERAEERSLEKELAELNRRAGDGADEAAALEEEIARSRRRLDAFRSRLYAAHPELRLARGEIDAITADRARALAARQRALIVVYAVTARSAYLFTLAIDPTEPGGAASIRVHTLAVGERELAERVQAFRHAIGSNDLAVAAEARGLFDLLLAPASAELAGQTRLVIVPDGPLWELPFQALQEPGGGYLLDRSAIVYAPSLTALEALLARALAPAGSGRGELLALGSPAPPSRFAGELPVLPQAERQARAIGGLFAPGERSILTGDAASESAAKREASRYRLIHIASHGFIDDRRPMDSWLSLTPSSSPPEDGRLEAREVINLPLIADLTVLSACETGRGRVAGGEGMIGLSWAFLIAGSANVLVSQWRVDADSTERLVLEFYRRALDGVARSARPMDFAEALREATLALRRDPAYRHPFHWAAFRLVGSGRASAPSKGGRSLSDACAAMRRKSASRVISGTRTSSSRWRSLAVVSQSREIKTGPPGGFTRDRQRDSDIAAVAGR